MFSNIELLRRISRNTLCLNNFWKFKKYSTIFCS